MDLKGYVLFHTAKDLYKGIKRIRLSELTDPELVSDEVLRLKFTGKGYILCDSNVFQEVYDGRHLPEQPDIRQGILLLRLECVWSDPSVNSGVWPELPSEDGAMQWALTSLNRKSFENCGIANVKGQIPFLNDGFARDEDVKKLNVLAGSPCILLGAAGAICWALES